MQLQAGSQAPPLTGALDVRGNTVSLAAHYGRTIGDHQSLDEVLRLAGAKSPALTGVA
jgi:hypothetical protein